MLNDIITTMNLHLIIKIISYLKDVHYFLHEKVDFSKQDKTHAIYLIQGGIITSLCSAFIFNQRGMVVSTMQLKRLIGEALDLLLFFDEIQDNSRQMKTWFEGEVVERKPGNSGNLTIEQRAVDSGLDVKGIKTLDNLRKKLNDALSKYCHPTINTMRANVYKRDNTFDYDHLNTIKAQINSKDFSDFFVVPAINALLITKNNFSLLSKDQVYQLNYYRKIIQPDIYPN